MTARILPKYRACPVAKTNPMMPCLISPPPSAGPPSGRLPRGVHDPGTHFQPRIGLEARAVSLCVLDGYDVGLASRRRFTDSA